MRIWLFHWLTVHGDNSDQITWIKIPGNTASVICCYLSVSAMCSSYQWHKLIEMEYILLILYWRKCFCLCVFVCFRKRAFRCSQGPRYRSLKRCKFFIEVNLSTLCYHDHFSLQVTVCFQKNFQTWWFGNPPFIYVSEKGHKHLFGHLLMECVDSRITL